MSKRLVKRIVFASVITAFLTFLISADGSRLSYALSAKKLTIICSNDTLGILEPCG